MKTFPLLVTAVAAALTAFQPTPAQAGHVYAGLTDTNGDNLLGAGDALSFVSNTTGTVVTGPSQGLQTMPLTTIGVTAGLYETSNISFTSLSSTSLVWTGSGSTEAGGYRADSLFGPSAGAYIQIQIIGVTGPAGAHFSFWDKEVNASAPVFSYDVGSLGASPYWNLTDPKTILGDGTTALPANPNGGTYSYSSYAPALNGLPSGFTWNDPTGGTAVADSYGHVHGRSFTSDLPGEYTVSYVLHDASGQNLDSQPFVVSYSAVPEPGTVALFALTGGFVLLLRLRASHRKA